MAKILRSSLRTFRPQSERGTLTIFDMTRGKTVHAESANRSSSVLALSPDSQFLAQFGGDGDKLTVRRVAPEEESAYSLPCRGTCLSSCLGAPQAFAVCLEDQLAIVGVESGVPLLKLPTRGQVSSVALSDSGKLVAYAVAGGSTVVCSSSEGRLWEHPTVGATHLAFSANSKLVAIGYPGGQVDVCNAPNGDPVSTAFDKEAQAHEHPICALHFLSGDGEAGEKLFSMESRASAEGQLSLVSVGAWERSRFPMKQRCAAVLQTSLCAPRGILALSCADASIRLPLVYSMAPLVCRMPTDHRSVDRALLIT